MHVALAGNQIAHVVQNAVNRAGCQAVKHHRSCSPALRHNHIQSVLFKQPLVHDHHGCHTPHVLGRQFVHVIVGPDICLHLINFRGALLRCQLHPVFHNGKIQCHSPNTEFLHQFTLIPNHREEGCGTGANLTDPQAGEILHHAGNSNKAVEALGKFRAFHPAARQMRERNVETLHLTGHPKQAALRIRGAHAVHVIFIIQRCPQQHRFTQCFGDIRCCFLIAEVAVDDHDRIDLFLLEALHHLRGRYIVKHQILDTDSLVVHKADMVTCEVFFNILHKALSTLLCRIPCQKSTPGSVCGIAAHCDQTDFYLIVQHC